MDVNDDEGCLDEHGALSSIASNRTSTGCSYSKSIEDYSGIV
ncbi:hypothetical protein PS850_03459 [Pseudomonas fluorescens]|nr:hypothetical protein PS850_03459 [Pseudomonas fluorescens]